MYLLVLIMLTNGGGLTSIEVESAKECFQLGQQWVGKASILEKNYRCLYVDKSVEFPDEKPDNHPYR